MSIDPLVNVPSSAAGTPVAQTTGSDVERSQQAATHRQRRVAARERAQAAAGVPATDAGDLKPDERDADGRRPWEICAPAANPAARPDGQPATAGLVKPDGDDRGARLDVFG